MLGSILTFLSVRRGGETKFLFYDKMWSDPCFGVLMPHGQRWKLWNKQAHYMGLMPPHTCLTFYHDLGFFSFVENVLCKWLSDVAACSLFDLDGFWEKVHIILQKWCYHWHASQLMHYICTIVGGMALFRLHYVHFQKLMIFMIAIPIMHSNALASSTIVTD